MVLLLETNTLMELRHLSYALSRRMDGRMEGGCFVSLPRAICTGSGREYIVCGSAGCFPGVLGLAL